jgi:hypothetical protein
MVVPFSFQAPQEEVSNYNPIIFLLPALCDCTATSTMYLGLTLTYASQFQVASACAPAACLGWGPADAFLTPAGLRQGQMLRGSVIIFTGLLSRFLLGRQLESYRWVCRPRGGSGTKCLLVTLRVRPRGRLGWCWS